MKHALIAFLLMSIVIFFIGQIPCSTKQGINYKVKVYSIPLYLKTLNFTARNENYKWLLDRIVTTDDDYEKIAQIWKWTIQNIKHQPEELDVVDDHVWNIIIRGYGKEDQLADAFATLCNYAEFSAFFHTLKHDNGTDAISVALVSANGKWYLFDLYRKCLFLHPNGGWSSLNDIVDRNFTLDAEEDIPENYYDGYLNTLRGINCNEIHRTNRSSIQTPWRRLMDYFQD